MANKRYPHDAEPADKRPVVREAKARPYGQGKEQPVALTIATVKRRLKKPVKRSKREIAWALEIAGIAEGPTDLSEKTRGYFYSNR